MFTEGQWMFAVFFVIAFAITMVISYRKDAKLHRKYYKWSILILIGFLVFIASLFVIKTYLH